VTSHQSAVISHQGGGGREQSTIKLRAIPKARSRRGWGPLLGKFLGQRPTQPDLLSALEVVPHGADRQAATASDSTHRQSVLMFEPKQFFNLTHRQGFSCHTDACYDRFKSQQPRFWQLILRRSTPYEIRPYRTPCRGKSEYALADQTSVAKKSVAHSTSLWRRRNSAHVVWRFLSGPVPRP
jgi:hypothetical protein